MKNDYYVSPERKAGREKAYKAINDLKYSYDTTKVLLQVGSSQLHGEDLIQVGMDVLGEYLLETPGVLLPKEYSLDTPLDFKVSPTPNTIHPVFIACVYNLHMLSGSAQRIAFISLFDSFNQICGVGTGSYDRGVEKIIRLVNYHVPPTTIWEHRVPVSTKISQIESDQLHDRNRKVFLKWATELSWAGKIYIAKKMVQNLQSTGKTTISPSFVNLVHQHRYVLDFPNYTTPSSEPPVGRENVILTQLCDLVINNALLVMQSKDTRHFIAFINSCEEVYKGLDVRYTNSTVANQAKKYSEEYLSKVKRINDVFGNMAYGKTLKKISSFISMAYWKTDCDIPIEFVEWAVRAANHAEIREFEVPYDFMDSVKGLADREKYSTGSQMVIEHFEALCFHATVGDWQYWSEEVVDDLLYYWPSMVDVISIELYRVSIGLL